MLSVSLGCSQKIPALWEAEKSKEQGRDLSPFASNPLRREIGQPPHPAWMAASGVGCCWCVQNTTPCRLGLKARDPRCCKFCLCRFEHVPRHSDRYDRPCLLFCLHGQEVLLHFGEPAPWSPWALKELTGWLDSCTSRRILFVCCSRGWNHAECSWTGL